MKQILFLALLVSVAACKKSESSGPSCADAINKGVDNMAKGPANAAAVTGRLKSVLIRRCTEDKWPAEVISCYTTVSDMQGMRKCRARLDPALNEKLMNEIRAVMMGGANQAGAPGHAAPRIPEGISPPISDVSGGGGATAPAGSGATDGSAAPGGAHAAPGGSVEAPAGSAAAH
ncbi:MAG: hypothetical protein ACTHU0_37510 [Kofleriaceae bacterium]